MTKRNPKRIIVHSLQEIPTSFESEDAERDWWAEHQLSGQLLDEMRPTWNDVGETGPLYLRTTELSEVEFPLGLARKYLGLIRRKEGQPVRVPGDVRLEHATIAIVFTAAAVEAGVNLFLAAPVLFLDDDNQRRFFGRLTSRQLRRMSLPEKLEFASSFCGKTGFKTRELAVLLERRNALVHAGVRYSELNQVDEDGSDGLRSALLASSGPNPEDIALAYSGFETAKEFLDALVLAPPITVDEASRNRAVG